MVPHSTITTISPISMAIPNGTTTMQTTQFEVSYNITYATSSPTSSWGALKTYNLTYPPAAPPTPPPVVTPSPPPPPPIQVNSGPPVFSSWPGSIDLTMDT